MTVQRPHGDPRRIDSEWTRIDPFTRVYPRDAWGFAEPGLVENTEASSREEFPFQMVVLGTGQAYSQLLHRARSGSLISEHLASQHGILILKAANACLRAVEYTRMRMDV